MKKYIYKIFLIIIVIFSTIYYTNTYKTNEGFKIKNKKTSKCIELNQNNPINNNITITDCSNNNNQEWVYENIFPNSSLYYIKNYDSSYCLNNNNNTINATICNESNKSQVWVTQNNNKNNSFQNLYNELYTTCMGIKNSISNDVTMVNCNYNPLQQWNKV